MNAKAKSFFLKTLRVAAAILGFFVDSAKEQEIRGKNRRKRRR